MKITKDGARAPLTPKGKRKLNREQRQKLVNARNMAAAIALMLQDNESREYIAPALQESLALLAREARRSQKRFNHA